MKVKASSRLVTVPLYQMDDGALEWGLPKRLRLQDGDDYVVHYYAEDERLDTLARTYLGNDRLDWVIIEVNDIQWPWDITVGTALKIPTQATLGKLISD